MSPHRCFCIRYFANRGLCPKLRLLRGSSSTLVNRPGCHEGSALHRVSGVRLSESGRCHWSGSTFAFDGGHHASRSSRPLRPRGCDRPPNLGDLPTAITRIAANRLLGGPLLQGARRHADGWPPRPRAFRSGSGRPSALPISTELRIRPGRRAELIRAHNNHASVTSDEGRGARFVVTIPSA